MWDGGACMEKSNCSHSEKKRACWIFTHGTTEQAYLNLFSFMNYTWLSSLSYTPRVKNILNDNLLISCQMGKIHSFLQICSWFCINILNDFREMHLGCLRLCRKKYARMLDPTFHSQYISNLHMWLWKQFFKKVCLGSFFFLQNTGWLFCSHVPGPAGKTVQVFACRRSLLIRAQARQRKPICKYFQVKLLKQQDYAVMCTVSVIRKFSSFD